MNSSSNTKPIVNLDARTAAAYGKSMGELLDRGQLDAAEQLARRIHAEYPGWGYAKIMRRLFDSMPPIDASWCGFTDDLRKDVQIVRRDGAESVLLVFCGFDHKLGFSLSTMHRWFGRLPVSLIYLRDFRSLFYLGGLSSLGGDAATTIEALREISAGLGRRIFCCSCSGGVFAALHYGLALRADAVLALSGPTNISSEFNTHLRSARRVEHLQTEMPGLSTIDLRQSYCATDDPPRVLITYDANNWDDRLQAEYMAGLPSVRLDPIDGHGKHAIIAELIVQGLFDARLGWLMGRSL